MLRKSFAALTATELDRLRVWGAEKNDYNYKIKYPAMALWQYHLIGRIDGVVHFGMSSPMGHHVYKFAIKTKVQWSKNVKEEADCHPQILFGLGDRYVILFFVPSLRHPPSYDAFFGQ